MGFSNSPLQMVKKTSTEETKAEKTPKKSAVVYIGHLPKDFVEVQMRKFFEQFGTIKHLRLSRSKKTGGSKHYGFVEFETPEVAEIVANTMNNYILFGQKLVCEVMKPADIHEDIWKGENKRFVRVANEPKMHELTKDTLGPSLESRILYNKKIQEKLDEMGIAYDFLKKQIKADEQLLKKIDWEPAPKEDKEKSEPKEKPVVKRTLKKKAEAQ